MMNRRSSLILAGTAVAAAAAGGGIVLSDVGSMEAYEESVTTSRAHLAAAPELADLVRYATLAANSHNTQPWRFRVRDARIDILPDFSRRTPVVDPDDHDLFISLGCAAENLVLAGVLSGRPIAAHYSEEEGGRIVCELGAGATSTNVDLAEAIVVRQSTRADYDGRSLDAATLGALAVAAREPGAEVALVTARADIDRLRDLVIAANGQQMADAAFKAELKNWVRFNARQALDRLDGLFSACSGNPQLPSFVAGTLFDWLVTADGENNRYRRQIDSSAGVAVFFAERNEASGWTKVGRAFERFALRATALGVRTAHVNQPVEVAQYRSDLARLAGNPGGVPMLVVRFGYGPQMPHSLRRPVADVLA